MEEIWKDIKGYEGYYQISNLGNVKSLPRNHTKGNILKSFPTKAGYERIALCKNGISKNFLIHRLVAEVFIPNPKNKSEVNHIDNNPSNNNANNLEWVTHKENMEHASKNGNMVGIHPKSIQMVDTFTNKVIKTYESAIHAYLDTGITRQSISNCLRKRSSIAGGYKWQYVRKEE